MKYRSAWVTVTGKVYVPDYEIADALRLKDNDERSAVEQITDVSPERVKITFQDCANDRIRQLIPSDDPLKITEIDIDTDSLV